MKRKGIIVLFLLSFAPLVQSQSIRWTSFEHLNDSLREAQKPLMIFIYTDWCKYCKMQENTTFQDSMLVEKFNQTYYCLKLNAEHKNEITFLNKTYSYNNLEGHHELAIFLGRKEGKLIFPTTIFYEIPTSKLVRLQGFQKKEGFY